MIHCISSLFPYRGEKGEHAISGKASPFKKCKGRCFVSGCSLHFDVPRRSVGGDLRLSGIAGLPPEAVLTAPVGAAS